MSKFLKRVILLFLCISATLIMAEKIKQIAEKTKQKKQLQQEEQMEFREPMEKHRILCERNLKVRSFLVFIPKSLDDYDEEFELRAACEFFSNDVDAWESGVDETDVNQ